MDEFLFQMASPSAPWLPNTENMQFINQSQGINKPTNHIEQLYMSSKLMHPYNNSEFLLKTFNYEQHYIQAFLSLPHQDKLRLYLLMEQKKLYGQFADQQAYKKILREIVKRVQNLHNFHRVTAGKVNQVEQSLQSRINSVCDTTFKILNIDEHFMSEKQGQVSSNKKQVDIEAKNEFVWAEPKEIPIAASSDDNEDWVEAELTSDISMDDTQSKQTPQPQQGQSSTYKEDHLIFPYLSQKTLPMATVKNNENQPVQFVFESKAFDSLFQSELQKNKLSIWELEISEEEIKKVQPNIHAVFGGQSQTIQQNESLGKEISSKVDISTALPSLNFQNSEPLASKYQIVQDQATLTAKKSQALLKEEESDEEEWEQATVSQRIDSLPNRSNSLLTVSKQESIITAHEFNKADFGYIEPTVRQKISDQVAFFQPDQQEIDLISLSPSQAPSQLSNVQVVQSQSTTTISVLQPTKEIPLITPQNVDLVTELPKNKYQGTVAKNILNLNWDFSGQQSVYQQAATATKEEVQIQDQCSINTSIANQSFLDSTQLPLQLVETSIFMNRNGSNIYYEVLCELKVNLSRSRIIDFQRQLVNKSFQCNVQFYGQVLQYMKELMLEQSQSFQLIQTQQTRAEEIHLLTNAFGQELSEDGEREVEASIKKSKQIYRQIYEQSQITERVVRELLFPPKSHGTLYNFGKVLVESNIQLQLIKKNICCDNKAATLLSFSCLYLLDKLNMLSKMKLVAEHIIKYTNEQYQIYRSLDQLKLAAVAKLNPEKYTTFLKGLIEIGKICYKVVLLIKVCSTNPKSSLKTLTMCRELISLGKQEESQANLVPLEYVSLLKKCAQKGQSVYQTHRMFSEMQSKLPLCNICLCMARGNDGSQLTTGWYHYSCYNLLKQIEKSVLSD